MAYTASQHLDVLAVATVAAAVATAVATVALVTGIPSLSGLQLPSDPVTVIQTVT